MCKSPSILTAPLTQKHDRSAASLQEVRDLPALPTPPLACSNLLFLHLPSPPLFSPLPLLHSPSSLLSSIYSFWLTVAVTRLRSDLLGTPRPACRCEARSRNNHHCFSSPLGKMESGCCRQKKEAKERGSPSRQRAVLLWQTLGCRNSKESKLKEMVKKKGMICPCVAGGGGASRAKKTLFKDRAQSDEESPHDAIQSKGSLCCWVTIWQKKKNYSKYFLADSLSQKESDTSATVPERTLG